MQFVTLQSATPIIVSIPLEPQHEGERRCPEPILTGIFVPPYIETLVQFGWGMKVLKNPLQVFAGESVQTDCEFWNRCVESMTSGALVRPLPWAGPAVVLKFASIACDAYVDFEPADIAHVREFFAMRL